ncbi:MAG: hypothetical protein M1834_003326 [Cirrosporium novae-zelandiae]|nr:MAG: hypothetical protein M1834_003326 [Cirrosporium novae-zelandiae]
MAPIHVTVWACAFCWQLFNSTCIGGWLAGYGPTNDEFWGSRPMKMQIGLILFVLGLTGNFWHDEELREIRQAAMKKQKNHAEEKDKAKKSVEKVYVMPENGLFAYILYPHYVCEWIEWMGFWLIGGMSFLPGQMFVVNEITTMLPRAVQGKRWYLEKFGKEKVGRRGAVIPGLLPKELQPRYPLTIELAVHEERSLPHRFSPHSRHNQIKGYIPLTAITIQHIDTYGLNRSPTRANFQNMPPKLDHAQPSQYAFSPIFFFAIPFLVLIHQARRKGMRICARADEEEDDD